MSYFSAVNHKNVITFDSGQSSMRSTVVRKTAALLLSQGLKVAVFAQINPAKTISFFRLLPSRVASEILSLGSYHRYLGLTKSLRPIIEELYYDLSFGKPLILLLEALRESLSYCIEELLSKGYYVLLDRSYYSTLAYQYYGQGVNQLNITEEVERFNPGLSVFVIDKAPLAGSKNTVFHDWQALDQKVKTWLRSLYQRKCKTNVYLYEPASADLDEGFIRYIKSYVEPCF